MHILSIFLFAISSSSDNLVVGLSYGAKKFKINLLNNLVISSISGIGTLLAMLFGHIFLYFFSLVHANIIGSAILILFGLCLLINNLRKTYCNGNNSNTGRKNLDYQYYENALRDPQIIDVNASKTMEFKEAIILGFVLCLNNIGLGIGAAITGLNIYIASFSSLLFSFIFIPLGYSIGKKVFSEKFSACSEIFSASIIIALGIYELFV